MTIIIKKITCNFFLKTSLFLAIIFSTAYSGEDSQRATEVSILKEKRQTYYYTNYNQRENIFSPKVGGQLSGETATFKWNIKKNRSYKLKVYPTDKLRKITYRRINKTTMSATVSRLPING